MNKQDRDMIMAKARWYDEIEAYLEVLRENHGLPKETALETVQRIVRLATTPCGELRRHY